MSREPPARIIERRLEQLIDAGAPPDERNAFHRLLLLLAEQELPAELEPLFPRYRTLRERWIESLHGDAPERVEEHLLELYCHLHMNDAPYTGAERRRLDATGGYWNHAGGLSPLVKAGPWIRADTVLADYGAGNGLQGLLLQKLYPHRRSVLIEISSALIDVGHRLQEWLEIPHGRVEWLAADLTTISPRRFDFIYLYRPVRPAGPGRDFYRWFASELDASRRQITLFSVADCLGSFLGRAFRVVYSDGHLTCFTTRPPGTPASAP